MCLSLLPCPEIDTVASGLRREVKSAMKPRGDNTSIVFFCGSCEVGILAIYVFFRAYSVFGMNGIALHSFFLGINEITGANPEISEIGGCTP